MDESGTVLMTIEIPAEKPGLKQAADVLGLLPDALDKSFGVVSVDPDRHLYAVQVKESAVGGRREAGQPYRGPFSNPKIAPFGPTR